MCVLALESGSNAERPYEGDERCAKTQKPEPLCAAEVFVLLGGRNRNLGQ
jgi:hypothetical protein